jgi:hypothetical protein
LDVIPLGYSTTISGDLTINLENFDDFFMDKTIYLYDKTTGIYHDLKQNSFTFTTTSGTFNDRFELRYATNSLTNSSFSDSDTKVNIMSVNQQLVVTSNGTSISEIKIYDTLGKLLLEQKGLSTNEYKTNLNNLSNQLLIVTLVLDDQKTFVKKISAN